MHSKYRILIHTFVNAYEEAATLTDTVYPGYFVKMVNNSGTMVFRNNTVLGGSGTLVALENTLVGGTITTAIAAGQRLRAKYPYVGDKFVVTVVDSLTVTIGDILTPSATAGKVEAAIGGASLGGTAVLVGPPSASGTGTTIQEAQMLLRAEEALTNTATDRAIIVRVIRV